MNPRIASTQAPGLAVDDAGKRMTRFRHRPMTARSRYRQRCGPVADCEETKGTINPRIASNQAPRLAVDDAGEQITRIRHGLVTASETLLTASWPRS